MTITTATLIDSVAEHLRIKAVDVTLSDEDADKIERYITRITNLERQTGLIWWVDNAIPEECEFPMMLMVASAACVGFGKGGQGYEAGYQDGKTQLARLKPSALNETVPAKYF